MAPQADFGSLLRTWRTRRRLSQLHLAAAADISQRHLSFVESGRATPSRAMVLHLAEQLAVPLRERNSLLVAAGYAPLFKARSVQSPELQVALQAVDQILNVHLPHPALAVDRHWNLQSANRAAMNLMAGVSPALLSPPINVLRLSLHPDGLAPRILNLREWATHLTHRLAQQAEVSADPVLMALLEELKSYAPAATGAVEENSLAGIAVALHLASDAGPLRFISTTTVFGTAVDITLAELTIESFYPADAHTAAVMSAQ
jgi:transcriptional regulator with XRE-family HTH domain